MEEIWCRRGKLQRREDGQIYEISREPSSPDIGSETPSSSPEASTMSQTRGIVGNNRDVYSKMNQGNGRMVCEPYFCEPCAYLNGSGNAVDRAATWIRSPHRPTAVVSSQRESLIPDRHPVHRMQQQVKLALVQLASLLTGLPSDRTKCGFEGHRRHSL